ncbi:MAG: hypothetical protein V4519_03695 [Patescibacteria group bacterium]
MKLLNKKTGSLIMSFVLLAVLAVPNGSAVFANEDDGEAVETVTPQEEKKEAKQEKKEEKQEVNKQETPTETSIPESQPEPEPTPETPVPPPAEPEEENEDPVIVIPPVVIPPVVIPPVLNPNPPAPEEPTVPEDTDDEENVSEDEEEDEQEENEDPVIVAPPVVVPPVQPPAPTNPTPSPIQTIIRQNPIATFFAPLVQIERQAATITSATTTDVYTNLATTTQTTSEISSTTPVIGNINEPQKPQSSNSTLMLNIPSEVSAAFAFTPLQKVMNYFAPSDYYNVNDNLSKGVSTSLISFAAALGILGGGLIVSHGLSSYRRTPARSYQAQA